MGTNMNFKNYGNQLAAEGSGRGSGRPPQSSPLARQSSVYALTFDEFQSSMGGFGKEFGSMNMDELLKNIWSAEDTQAMGIAGVAASGGHLQRQGSITLPRTLSQKTVDEVWRDLSKEYGEVKDVGGFGGSNLPQRQQTLGEITLEEFLVKAGVVREDTQLAGNNPNNTVLFGDLSNSGNNPGLGIGFQQGLMSNRIPENNNQIANLPLNVNGIRSTQQQLPVPQSQQQQQPQQLQQQQQQPPQLFPKQPALGYGAPMPVQSNSPLGGPGIRGGIVGLGDSTITSNLVQSAAALNGLGTRGVTIATASPLVSSDGLGKSNGDLSSVSPSPYVFNGGLRGRKSAAVEKVVERRQRRMIKNRESAARSRARKQAYTTELEAEVAKLKEENQELRKKQAKIVEMQKNQVMEMMNMPRGMKRRRLRRVQTGPW